MKYLRILCIILVGGLFIFSGLIKLNDPVGTQIKLEEYFEVFASDKKELGLSIFAGLWHFLVPFALSLSIILSSLEVILGVSLLLRYKIKSTLWWLLAIVIFFSFLTFYSAYFNKVTDCGCFGDFIKLTPWGSFTKDIILLVLIGFLVFQRNKIKPNVSKIAYYSVLGTSLASFLIGLLAVWYLPWFDFLPYKVGDNIPQNMKPKEPLKYGADEYYYRNLKDNSLIKLSKKEFEEEWEKYSDSTKYKYLEYKKPLLNPEAKAKIPIFEIYNTEGQNITQEIMKGNQFLIIIPDIQRTNPKSMPKIVSLAKELEKKNIKPIILSGDTEKSFENFRHTFQLPIPYYLMDKTILKTMIRTNPGFIWLENGTVKKKWADANLPSIQQF